VGPTGGALTVAARDRADLVAALERQRAAWEQRPLVRELYREWHGMAVGALSTTEGPVIELGCGFGAFKEHHPLVMATDVAPTPWAETVLDAGQLDLSDRSVANLVMTDVFHHLPHPGRFLAEAERVLAPGGRVVMVEPYCSPASYPAYRLLHFEGADLRPDPFSGGALSTAHPLEANNALATLIFWRYLRRFERVHPSLAVRTRERFAFFLYPLSGGLTGRELVPRRAVGALGRAERALAPLAGALAFRCLVVLEKRERG